MEDDETTRLFRIYRTVMQMLYDRGYLVDDTELCMTKLQFMETFGEIVTRESLTIKKAKKNDQSEQIFVFFPSDEKVGVGNIKHYVAQMNDASVPRAIIVTKKSLTPFAKSSLQALSSKFRLETFEEKELFVNITVNKLVPQHQEMTNEEKKAILQRYTVKENQLPRIQVTDPIARYYGLQRGRLVKIVRRDLNDNGDTVDEYVTYRVVV